MRYAEEIVIDGVKYKTDLEFEKGQCLCCIAHGTQTNSKLCQKITKKSKACIGSGLIWRADYEEL